jgi:hypothetical protein
MRKSHGDLPPATLRPQQIPCQPRPASDGIFLSNSFQPPSATANSTAPIHRAGQPPSPPNKPRFCPRGHYKGRGQTERQVKLSFHDNWSRISAYWPLGAVCGDRACLGIWVSLDHSQHGDLPLPPLVMSVLML